MKDILNIIATNIKRERLAKNLSQEGLADISQFHRTYIGMIERSERNITIINLQKIANALGMEVYDLLKEN